MNLKFISPKELSGSARATVHKTGKLGLSTGAADKLNLDTTPRYARIAINGDYTDDKNLYIIVSTTKTEDSYLFAKAGDYFYISLKYFFEKLNEDYEGENIVYDVKKGDFDPNGFVFERRK